MAEKEGVSYRSQYFLLLAGIALLIIGCFMVLEVNIWAGFGVWFSAAVTLLGVLMVGSRIYSTPLGFLFINSGGAILFHQLGFFRFPYLTTILGWCLVAAGCGMIVAGAVEVWRKIRRPTD